MNAAADWFPQNNSNDSAFNYFEIAPTDEHKDLIITYTPVTLDHQISTTMKHKKKD